MRQKRVLPAKLQSEYCTKVLCRGRKLQVSLDGHGGAMLDGHALERYVSPRASKELEVT